MQVPSPPGTLCSSHQWAVPCSLLLGCYCLAGKVLSEECVALSPSAQHDPRKIIYSLCNSAAGIPLNPGRLLVAEHGQLRHSRAILGVLQPLGAPQRPADQLRLLLLQKREQAGLPAPSQTAPDTVAVAEMGARFRSRFRSFAQHSRVELWLCRVGSIGPRASRWGRAAAGPWDSTRAGACRDLRRVHACV